MSEDAAAEPVVGRASATIDAFINKATGGPLAPLPPDHPQYALIGRVAAEWARFEHVLDLIIWKLLGVTAREGAAETGGLIGPWKRFDKIEALAKHPPLTEATITSVGELRARCSDPCGERNRIVHDAWFDLGAGGVGQFKCPRGKELAFGVVDIDPATTEETMQKIRNLAQAAEQLRADISRELKGGSGASPP